MKTADRTEEQKNPMSLTGIEPTNLAIPKSTQMTCPASLKEMQSTNKQKNHLDVRFITVRVSVANATSIG